MEENKDIEIKNDVEETPKEKTIIVKDWISLEESESHVISFEGQNMSWKKGDRWNDYIGWLDRYEKMYAQALFDEISNNNIRISGYEHITLDEGIPLFNDNTVAYLGMWDFAKLQAAIWSEKENKDYEYGDFMA